MFFLTIGVKKKPDVVSYVPRSNVCLSFCLALLAAEDKDVVADAFKRCLFARDLSPIISDPLGEGDEVSLLVVVVLAPPVAAAAARAVS